MSPLSYLSSLFKGRNLSGRVGLFPQSYTTPAPPTASVAPSVPTDSQASSTTLQPLDEEPESPSPSGKHTGLNGLSHTKEPSQGDGEVMKATMTDVQKAIEQLGRNNGSSVRDDARSFSFASTRTGDDDLTDRDTDTDIDMDTDREDTGGGDDWHRDARAKLAEQSRIVVEEQKKKEEEENPIVRSVAPPIEVEMSDESEGEEGDEDHHHRLHTSYTREHPHIPEEDENEEERRPELEPEEEEEPPTARTQDDLILPAADESALPTATTRTAFPQLESVPEVFQDNADHSSARSLPTPTSPDTPSHDILTVEPQVQRNASPSLSVPEKASAQVTPTPSTLRDPIFALPSPAASSVGQQQASKHSSLASSVPSAPTATSLQPPPSDQSALKDKKPTTHPSEWTVEEVVDWLKSKGFGDDVCEKFIGMSSTRLAAKIIY